MAWVCTGTWYGTWSAHGFLKPYGFLRYRNIINCYICWGAHKTAVTREGLHRHTKYRGTGNVSTACSAELQVYAGTVVPEMGKQRAAHVPRDRWQMEVAA